MRVGKLERRVHAAGACKLCGGLKRVKVLIGEDKLPPEPCRRCGREWVVIRIVRGYPPPGGEEGREERHKPPQSA